MTFSIKVELQKFEREMDAYTARAEAAARPAAQAAAQVLYDQVKRNVAGIKRHTGNLDRGIYQAFSRDNSRTGKATYHVSWNYLKAPHGHLVEFGHLLRYEISYDPQTRRFITHKDRPLPEPRQVAARPFLRPAMSKAAAAAEAATAEFLARLDKDAAP